MGNEGKPKGDGKAKPKGGKKGGKKSKPKAGKKRKPGSARHSLTRALALKEERQARALVDRARAAAREPLLACQINPGWQEEGLASIVLTRGRPGGRIALAGILVDLHGIGLKDVHLDLAADQEMLELASQFSDQPVEPELALGIVQEGRRWAEGLGLPLPPSLEAARCLFGDITPAEVPVPFGVDGAPRYVVGPGDDVLGIVTRLREAVGDDFEVAAPEHDDQAEQVETFLDCFRPLLSGAAGEPAKRGSTDFVALFCASVWNAGRGGASPQQVADKVRSRLDHVPDALRDALEEVTPSLAERRLEMYGQHDFEVTPDMALLAALLHEGKLEWHTELD